MSSEQYVLSKPKLNNERGLTRNAVERIPGHDILVVEN